MTGTAYVLDLPPWAANRVFSVLGFDAVMPGASVAEPVELVVTDRAVVSLMWAAFGETDDLAPQCAIDGDVRCRRMAAAHGIYFLPAGHLRLLAADEDMAVRLQAQERLRELERRMEAMWSLAQ